MSIGELVFTYAVLFCIFLTLFIIVLLRRRAAGKAVFPQVDWNSMRQVVKPINGELCLKIAIAATITASAAVSIALFILPYGAVWALAVLAVVLLALAFTLPKLLA